MDRKSDFMAILLISFRICLEILFIESLTKAFMFFRNDRQHLISCLIKNVEMMPYYLSAADSEANDKAYLETFQSIADSVAK